MPSNCDNLSWLHYIAFFLVLIWEFWLGRTSRFKPNSTISLIATIAAAIIARLFERWRKNARG